MIDIAIDTGGTFTDYTSIGSLDDNDEKKIFIKNPTNHENPTQGIIEGLKQLAQRWDCDLRTLLENTNKISHGTTLALNALLEKKGVKTALFTTEGFRDALELRRSRLDNQWDIRAVTPQVLVPRRLRLPITERVDYKGDVITQLDEDSVRRACKICKDNDIKSIAVCFLFSFLNPSHEQRVRQIINEELPDVFVSLSSDVSPQIREYERTSTTVINASITPIISTYFDKLKDELKDYGWTKPIHIMMNSGGLSDVATMKKIAAKSLLSGPAGGGVGNETLSRILSKKHLILADMGGTSFDLHIIDNNKTQLVPESRIDSYPITLPMMDIQSIGAGGGSIVSVDASKRVHVGPESASSVPGPACYNLGGTQATITDALLALNLINEDNFLGGRLKLSKEKAIESIEENVAKPLDITVDDAAVLIYTVATQLMADALRLITTKRGNDPRQYSLVTSGGAFGLFACNIMDTLSMDEVIVPIQAPVFCSWGMMGAKRRYDITQSFFMEKNAWDSTRLNNQINKMLGQANNELDKLNVSSDNRKHELILEMRYIGQHHEISIALDKLQFDDDSIEELNKLFHDTHNDIYQYCEMDNDWEIMNIRLASFEENVNTRLFEFDDDQKDTYEINLSNKLTGTADDASVTVYHECDLNDSIVGPAVIEFDYTSVLVPEGFTSNIIDDGLLSIRKIN
ncbi:MAG: methylhydantoinase [Methanosphaera sp. SHI613]|nr:MAG: methylhydantoinase [Methanosphaera sp. SHI613]